MSKRSFTTLMFAMMLLIASLCGMRNLSAGEDGAAADPNVLLGEWTNGLFAGEVRTVSIGSLSFGSANASGYYFGSNGLLIHVYSGHDQASLFAGRLTARYRVDGNRILLTDVSGTKRNVLDNTGPSADKPLPDAVKYFRISQGADGVTRLAIADRAEDLDAAALFKQRKTASGSPAGNTALPKEAEPIIGTWRYGSGTPDHTYGKPLSSYAGGGHYAAVLTFNPDGTYTEVYSGSGPNSTASGTETARFRIEGDRIHFSESFQEFYDPNLPEKSFINKGYSDRTEYFELRVDDRGLPQIAVEYFEKDLSGPHPWYTKIVDEPGAAKSDAGSPALAIEYPKADEVIGSWRRGTVNPDLPYDASLDQDNGYHGEIHIFNPDGTWMHVTSSAIRVIKTGTRQTAKYRVDENKIFLTEFREDQVNPKVPAMSYRNKQLPDTTLFFRIQATDTGGKQIIFSVSEIGLERSLAVFDKDAEARPAER